MKVTRVHMSILIGSILALFGVAFSYARTTPLSFAPEQKISLAQCAPSNTPATNSTPVFVSCGAFLE